MNQHTPTHRVGPEDGRQDVSSAVTRVPPHDLDAEAVVLSACLAASENVAKVRSIIEPTQFYSEANQWIFRAVCSVADAGDAVTLASVAGWLLSQTTADGSRLRQVGGSQYLALIADEVPAVLHVERHAAHLRDLADFRYAAQIGQELAVAAYASDKGEVARLREAVARSTASVLRSLTPAQVVARWHAEGPLVRLSTGIAELDEATRGGLPVPWRTVIVGAPSAGKTFIAVAIADHLARNLAAQGVTVGILAVDEDPDDMTVRLAQIAGFTVAQAELRAPETLRAIEAALAPLAIYLYDASYTIESAAEALAAHVASQQRGHGCLFVDSIQAASSVGARRAKAPREVVEANMQAVRGASTRHRMLVVATSEANRASYRDEDASLSTNDLAAGAESRAIEFGAQTLLVVRTPKDHRDLVHVRIAKNRRAHVGEFWLRLDRDSHSLSACREPSRDPAVAEREATRKREAARRLVEDDAWALADVVRQSPGRGERELRAAVRAMGHTWGRERLDAAQGLLVEGLGGVHLVNRGGPSSHRWFIEEGAGVAEGDDG
ncbi:MAG: AAA family ATPase [Myxococcales bacterium]|nr:AAA family ATPase [Myxococcales bacterium]